LTLLGRFFCKSNQGHYLDVAHNPQAAVSLGEQSEKQSERVRTLVCICYVGQIKDIAQSWFKLRFATYFRFGISGG